MGDVIESLSADAFVAFHASGCDLWDEEPHNAQVWFTALGPVAPLAVNAGLSLDEALALREQGRLDEASLVALAGLRAPAA